MNDLVSVIVPVFNIEDYLPHCLDCLANQTYKNLEIILVDDGSTDGSGRLCDEYATKDSRATVIHQHNQGLWAARNTGKNAASGEFLFFPDGDDYFHRDIIRIMYETINQDPAFDLAVVRKKKTWKDDEDTTSLVIPRMFIQTREDLIRGILAQGEDHYYAYMWNKLYRRSLIQNLQCEEYVRSQDFDFNIKAFLCTRKAAFIDNDMYFWLQRQGSLTKMPDSVLMMHCCRTRALHRNYFCLSGENVVYRSVFLAKLYKTMVLWKARSASLENRQSIFEECQYIERTTRKSFLLDKHIGIHERIQSMVLLHTPSLTRILMRITHNL